jgi:dTDP-L-rhamnose 4-epimerase
MRVLVTGAAGFIGSAVADALTDAGHDVVGLDAMIEQSHPGGVQPPPDVALADLRDPDAIGSLLDGVDVVCHQAAMVGAGVDASDLPRFAAHNDLATAVLLAEMTARHVDRLVLASSMVVYGDGRYVCDEHTLQIPGPRRAADLDAGRFEVSCSLCGRHLRWQPVDEDAPLAPRSGYAAGKVAQEHYTSAWCRQANGAAVALRYHNVYGPGMPQDNPYSGVAAIFRSALERGEAPRVFEDGRQTRDFVHVSDVAAANVRAVAAVAAAERDTFTPFNVCSGQPISIGEVADAVARGAGGASPRPVTTGDYRLGDVRHIVASPVRAARDLGFEAKVGPTAGLADFATAPMRPVAAPPTSG